MDSATKTANKPNRCLQQRRPYARSLISLWVVIVQICGCNGCCGRALGAASAVEGLLVLGAMQWWAHDVAAQGLVSIVVHADATRQSLCPRPVLWHSDFVGPAKRAASA